MFKSYLCLVFLALSFSVGCGSNGSSSSGGGTPAPPSITPANIQGQYEVVVTSSSDPTNVSLIETNFSQTGTSVSASTQNVVTLEGTQGSGGITITAIGGECDNGVVGDDSLAGTFSSNTQSSISFTEAGSLGTVTATGTVNFSSDGTQLTSGTYSIPAACGFLADGGTITGTQVKPFSGTYSGMLSNGSGTDAVIVTITQNGYTLNVTGTDNGTPFTLTGSAVGASFDVTGTIAGQSVEDVGLYDHINNTFLVTNSQLGLLGTLSAGSNPQAAVAPSSMFKVKR